MRTMKDSGIPWIGNIPADWDVHPVGYYFGERKNRNYNLREENLLSLSYGKIVRKDINTVGGLLPASFSTYNVTESGDIIIRPTDLQNDKRSLRTGLVTERGIITSAYIDLMPKRVLNSSYHHYLLHTYDVMKVFYNMGNGVRQGLNYSEFAKLMVFSPSLFEQRRIADFLDSKCTEIDTLVADVQKEIDVLERYKRSVITEAVTKGLDRNVTMRKSGIPWIGMIPFHWKIGRIKDQFSVVLGKMLQTSPKSSSDTLETYACASNLKWLGYNADIKKTMWFSPAEKEEYLLAPGDVLVMEGGTAGTSCIYQGENAPCYMQNSVNRCRNKSGYPNKLLYYWLFHVFHCGYIESICNKATIMHYTKEKIENTPLILPGKNEQVEIVDYLNAKCAEIDSIVATKQRQLAVLDAYKKSLIYEYVTGKKEVP